MSISDYNQHHLPDLMGRDTESEWTCGHVGGSHCAECYRELARKAHQLAIDNLDLREQVESLLETISSLQRSW